MHNIFHFATSELSQDAMIAWLMECANADDDALRKVGRSFIRFLLDRPLQMTDGCTIQRAVIGSNRNEPEAYDGPGEPCVKEVCVKTQWQRIDVYCHAKVGGKQVSFVIEDKTNTMEHGDQLARYRKAVRDDDLHEDYLKLIYLKTGMPYKHELDKARGAYYCHVGVYDLDCFLEEQTVESASSDLLQQYRQHIAAEAEKQRTSEREWNMDLGPIQRRFADALWCRTRNANGRVPTTDSELGDDVWIGRNPDGGYWTQYRFFGCHLFWRMDSWRPLRLMVDTGHEPSSPDIDRYRESFGNACACVEDIEPYQGVRFRRGKEMTLGAIQYPCPSKREQDMDAFLDRVAQVHERFLEQIAIHGVEAG